MTDQRQERLGLLFVLIGPPGAGKNALMNDALARATNGNLRQLATATTRSIRPTEQQGREHHFMDTASFHALMNRGELLEWQKVHGNLYGIPRRTLEEAFENGQDLTADIDVLGATYIRSLYPDNVVLIFIAPPSVDELETRMRTRGETEEAIATRMKRVTMEMTYAPLCDYMIVNDDLPVAAERFNRIIELERERLRRKTSPSRQIEYLASSVPLYQDLVLVCDHEPYFAQDVTRNGEMPHQAALRLMHDTFNVAHPTQDNLFEAAPHEGSFVPPVLVEGTNTHIHFLYAYWMSEQIMPPEGWQWKSMDDAPLPQAALEILRSRQPVGNNA